MEHNELFVFLQSLVESEGITFSNAHRFMLRAAIELTIDGELMPHDIVDSKVLSVIIFKSMSYSYKVLAIEQMKNDPDLHEVVFKLGNGSLTFLRSELLK
jgi:hypothetical protein